MSSESSLGARQDDGPRSRRAAVDGYFGAEAMRGRRAFDLAENLFERRGRRHVEGLVENLRNVAALSIERSVGTSPSALELQRRAPVADALIVQSSDAGTAKHLVLDDHAARQITAALQRHVVTDADVAFDVRVGADHAVAADDRFVADEDESCRCGPVRRCTRSPQ